VVDLRCNGIILRVRSRRKLYPLPGGNIIVGDNQVFLGDPLWDQNSVILQGYGDWRIEGSVARMEVMGKPNDVGSGWR